MPAPDFIPIRLTGTPVKVLVSGSRDYADRDTVWGVLDDLDAETPISVIIHGSAYGADTLAELWAKHRQVPYLGVPAKWKAQKRSAGPNRNRFMKEIVTPDVAVFFPLPQSVGTLDMLDLIKAHNASSQAQIKVIVIEPNSRRAGRPYQGRGES